MYEPSHHVLWRFYHSWSIPSVAFKHGLLPELLAAVAWVHHQVPAAPDRVGWMRLPMAYLPAVQTLGFQAEDLYWPDYCIHLIAQRLSTLKETHPRVDAFVAAHQEWFSGDLDADSYLLEVALAQDYLLLRQGLAVPWETPASHKCQTLSRWLTARGGETHA